MLRADLRHTIRGLLKDRSFALAALISLSLGIGLNVAIFSFTDAVLLRPFPYRNADRLVFIWGTKSIDVRRGINGGALDDWRNQSHAFSDIAVFQINPASFEINESGSVQGALVGPHVFPLLGPQPLLGSTFSETKATEKQVILSYGLWRSRFAQDTKIVGKSIRLNGDLYSVVGVMPRGFFFPDQTVRLWVPLARDSEMFESVQGVARLRSGFTLRDAQAELDVLSGRLRQSRLWNSALPVDLGVFPLYVVVVGKYGTAFWTLFGAVLLMLLIACANVSNLLLARDIARESEFAIRASLGASPLNIFVLLLLENVLLSLGSGVFGVVCAWWGVLFIRGLRLSDIPRFESAHIDLNVLLFALAVSVASGLLSGVLPAWKFARANFRSISQHIGASPPVRRQLRNLVVAIEVSVSLVLLASAGLLINSFVRLTHAEWGFNPDHVLLLEARASKSVAQNSGVRSELADEIVGRLSRIPGVLAAAMAYAVPTEYVWTPTHLAVDGRYVTTDWIAGSWVVGSNYFQTMQIPILFGREFEQKDNELAPRVVVVSKSLAQKLWPAENPVGKQIEILRLKKQIRDRLRKEKTVFVDPSTWRSGSSWGPDGTPWTVIGEVRDVRMFGLDTDPDPEIYLDYRQATRLANAVEPSVERFVVRTSTEPLQVASVAKAQFLSPEEDFSVTNVTTMGNVVSGSIGGRGSNRLLLVVSTMFGSLSLVLVIVGIYAVVSFATAQQNREIGIRRALGAQTKDVAAFILAQNMRPVFLGLVLGMAAATALTRFFKPFLFGVTPTDPLTLACVSILLLIAACAACLLPVIRGLRVNPSEALREQ